MIKKDTTDSEDPCVPSLELSSISYILDNRKSYNSSLHMEVFVFFHIK